MGLDEVLALRRFGAVLRHALVAHPLRGRQRVGDVNGQEPKPTLRSPTAFRRVRPGVTLVSGHAQQIFFFGLRASGFTSCLLPENQENKPITVRL